MAPWFPGPWSLVSGPWFLIPSPWWSSLVPGPWSWSLVAGSCSLVPLPWSLITDPWSLVIHRPSSVGDYPSVMIHHQSTIIHLAANFSQTAKTLILRIPTLGPFMSRLWFSGLYHTNASRRISLNYTWFSEIVCWTKKNKKFLGG